LIWNLESLELKKSSLAITICMIIVASIIPYSSITLANEQVTLDLLNSQDLVILITGRFADQHNVDEYTEYVSSGGALLLLTDHHGSEMTKIFGLYFDGSSIGNGEIDTFSSHPITSGVSSITSGSGSGLITYPQTASVLGWYSNDTFLDLNDNDIWDNGEPYGPPVLGCMIYGSGKIVFIGDIIGVLWIEQPFADNYLGWLGVTAGDKILVDASYGGGMWWSPQDYPFDENLPHQGKALADYLKSLGCSVTELARITDTPTPTPTSTPTPAPTSAFSPSPIPSISPTPTPIPSPTQSPSPTLTSTPTDQPTPTPSITVDSSLFVGPIIGSIFGIVGGIVITLILLRGRREGRNFGGQKKWILIAGIMAIIFVVLAVVLYSFSGGLFNPQLMCRE
jgi:hypothetical protein